MPELVQQPTPAMVDRASRHAAYLAACRWPVNWDVTGQLQQMWSRGGHCWYRAGDIYWGVRPTRRNGDVAQMVVLPDADRQPEPEQASAAAGSVLALVFDSWAFRKCEWWLAEDADAFAAVAEAADFAREATFDGAIRRPADRVGLVIWGRFGPIAE